MDKYEENPDEIINEIIKQKSNNMEFKGTKGKWEADEDTVYTLDETIHGNLICVIPEGLYVDSRKNWEANKKLISKAPEMLDFIKYVYNSMPKVSTLQTKAEKLIKEATTI